MNLATKFKETISSVVPIMAIVIVLGLTVAPLGAELMGLFIVAGVLVIIGLTLFLAGVDIGILPIGEAAGSALVKKRNLPLLLIVAFITGFFITVAEPDVQVLGDQIHSVNAAIQKTPLVLMIAVGVGLFIALGLLRTVLSLPLNVVLAISYAALFALAAFTPESFVPVAFDSGGATTGPMTVPFIMALGMGVAAVRGNDNDSFGLTGMASVGPIMAVLVFGLMAASGEDGGQAAAEAAEGLSGFAALVAVIPDVLKEVINAMLPLTVLFVVFQVTLVKMPPVQVRKMVKGLVYAFFGLVLFLAGVKGGFMEAGQTVGAKIGALANPENGINGYTALLVVVGLLLGAVVVCAEPAVWVLTDQVEEVSGGTIKRKTLLAALSGGVAVSIGLAMVRVMAGFSIWWYIVPGYLLSIIMTFFCPKMFTAIAFDSGGVASGPMTSTFILSFTLGAAIACGGDPEKDAFGVVALVAMTPLIAIQALGLVYKGKMKKAEAAQQIEDETEAGNGGDGDTK